MNLPRRDFGGVLYMTLSALWRGTAQVVRAVVELGSVQILVHRDIDPLVQSVFDARVG
jgi:hypothetical protein